MLGRLFFFRKNPYRDFFKIPVLEEIGFFKKVPIGKIISLYVGSMLWCVETLNFSQVPQCVGSVLWCVETLNFSQVPLCVGCVVRGGFKNFH